jgi:hypothetical protein
LTTKVFPAARPDAKYRAGCFGAERAFQPDIQIATISERWYQRLSRFGIFQLFGD